MTALAPTARSTTTPSDRRHAAREANGFGYDLADAVAIVLLLVVALAATAFGIGVAAVRRREAARP